jgi:hypothetical protein
MSINNTIPPQAFERIRCRICEILTAELAIQADIDETTAPTVWEERFKTFDETQVPAINVCINDGRYDNETVVRSEGIYTFNIDVYTAADTNADIRGDKSAMLKMSQLIGRICTILRNPQYIMLGFERGTVSRRKVESFFIGDKTNITDALSNVVGRITLTVIGIETNETAIPVVLDISGTRVTLKESDQGFYYQFNTN